MRDMTVGDGAAGSSDVEDPEQSLQAPDLPKTGPWMSMILHSLFCVFFAVGLPKLLLLGLRFYGYRIDIVHHKLVHSSLKCDDFFPSWDLLVACGFAFVAGFIFLFVHPYEQRILARTFSCHRHDQCISSSSWFKRPAFVCGLLLFALLPLAAWTSRSVWEALVARELYSCAQECNDAAVWLSDHSSSRAEAHHQHEVFIASCRNSSLDRLPESRCGWNDTAPLPTIAKLLGGSGGLDANKSKMRCSATLHEKETPYVRKMLRHNNTYGAFESRLRHSNQISLWDVFGAPMSVTLFIMMLCSRIAVSVEAESLDNTKWHKILTVLKDAKDDEDPGRVVNTYKLLFQRLGSLSGQEVMSSEGEFFENLPVDKLDDKRALYHSHEVSLKSYPSGSSRSLRNSIQSVLFALVFSAGSVLLPSLSRISSFFGDAKQPFFASTELAPALILNASVSVFFAAAWFTIFVRSSCDQAEKLQLAADFDLLWQFPTDGPVKATARGETYWFLQEARPDPDVTFNEQGYRASFAGVHGVGVNEMMKELHKLDEWNHLREYLAMDQTGAHIAMKLAASVAGCCLVPRVMILAYNMRAKLTTWMLHVTVWTLWDFTFIAFFIFRALRTTLELNDWRYRHQDRLSGLVAHMKLHCAEALEPVRLVEAKLSTLETSNAPLSFAGVAVTRKIVNGFGSLLLLFVALGVLRVVLGIHKGS